MLLSCCKHLSLTQTQTLGDLAKCAKVMAESGRRFVENKHESSLSCCKHLYMTQSYALDNQQIMRMYFDYADSMVGQSRDAYSMTGVAFKARGFVQGLAERQFSKHCCLLLIMGVV